MSTAYAMPVQAAGAVQVPPHERVVLPNGVTLIIVPRRDVPLIAFQAVLRGGPLGDPLQAGRLQTGRARVRPVRSTKARAGSSGVERASGVSSVVAGLLEKGAGDRDAFGFADAEGVAAQFVFDPAPVGTHGEDGGRLQPEHVLIEGA